MVAYQVSSRICMANDYFWYWLQFMFNGYLDGINVSDVDITFEAQKIWD